MKLRNFKLNILDIAIIFIFISIIVGAVVRMNLSSAAVGGEKVAITIVLNVEDETKSLSKALALNSDVTISDSQKKLGNVSAVVNRNNVKYVADGETFTKQFTDDKYRVLIRIQAEAIKNENGLFVTNNLYIAPGKSLQLETDKCVFNGTIVEIIEH